MFVVMVSLSSVALHLSLSLSLSLARSLARMSLFGFLLVTHNSTGYSFRLETKEKRHADRSK
jgi:hypothetical protein